MTTEMPKVMSEVEAGGLVDAVDMFETPEADRVFAPPTPDEIDHFMRDLAWGEHLIATRMAPSRGNTETYFFSLKHAALFFFDDNSGGVSLGSSGAFAWVDVDKYIAWVRDVIGDTELARVTEEATINKTTFNDKIEALRYALLMRMMQLEPELFTEDELDEKHNAPEAMAALA